MRWHCPPDTGFKIRALAVWGRAHYLSVTEAPHNIESLQELITQQTNSQTKHLSLKQHLMRPWQKQKLWFSHDKNWDFHRAMYFWANTNLWWCKYHGKYNIKQQNNSCTNGRCSHIEMHLLLKVVISIFLTHDPFWNSHGGLHGRSCVWRSCNLLTFSAIETVTGWCLMAENS